MLSVRSRNANRSDGSPRGEPSGLTALGLLECYPYSDDLLVVRVISHHEVPTPHHDTSNLENRELVSVRGRDENDTARMID
jgi:hypothetical protein